MMQVAKLDDVPGTGGLGVSPRPADAHCGIEEVGNIAMADRAIVRVEDGNTNRRGKVTAAGVDDGILHAHMAGLLRSLRRDARVADFDSAGTEVVHPAIANLDVAAAAAEPHRIGRGLGEFALVE